MNTTAVYVQMHKGYWTTFVGGKPLMSHADLDAANRFAFPVPVERKNP